MRFDYNISNNTNAQGRVQQISRLSMGVFEPGSYELRVMVQAGMRC
jgi:hypothetical protein